MAKTVAVLAGGEIASYSQVAKLLEGAIVLCADSGYHHAEVLKIKPALLVGDFDSIKEIPKDISTLTLPQAKNYTDSVYAVKKAMEYAPDTLLLVGMLGGRLDHSLANLALLVSCKQQGVNTILTDGLTTVYPLVYEGNGEPMRTEFEPIEDHYFSLLAYSETCLNVTILGGKYPLTNHTLTNTSARAVSNEFTDRTVTIAQTSGTILFITTPID